jgi:hypothetical protein
METSTFMENLDGLGLRAFASWSGATAPSIQ